MRKLGGICPVLPVPFLPDCETDFASLDRVALAVLDAGVSGLAILGLGSECWKFTEAERGALVEAVVRRAAGAVPVVAGVGADSARVAIEQARLAERAGASILMVLPPLAFRLGEQALVDYYRAIGDACGLPLMLQDTSSAGVNQMSLALIERIASEVPGLLYAKIETVPAGPRITALKQRTALELFSGNGALLMLDALERGVVGVMPGADLVGRFVRIWDLYKDGRTEEAAALHRAILPLLALECQTSEAFVAIVKQVLYLQGVIASPLVRPPAAYQVDEIAARQVAAAIAQLEQLP